ncbi:MAG: NUDIX domain-containing protein [Lachnospiraceae bacterium]|nr:NUDIX domain-containing protein [Lachnospiraceae bacterium]
MKIRKSARAIVINSKNQMFLFQYMFDYLEDSKAIWITPGGSLEEGESFADALKREVYEELGVQLTKECPEVYYRNPIYTLKNGEKVQSVEKFFLVVLEEKSFSFDHWTESEKKRMRAGKWWSVDEIEKSEDEFFSKDIVRMLKELASRKLPEEPRIIV